MLDLTLLCNMVWFLLIIMIVIVFYLNVLRSKSSQVFSYRLNIMLIVNLKMQKMLNFDM